MCFIIHENWTPENFNDFTVWIIEICVHHALFFLHTKQPSITSIDWSDKMQGKTWSCDPALSWPILLTSPTPNFTYLFCWPPWIPISLTYFADLPDPNLTDLFCWPPQPPISLTYFAGLPDPQSHWPILLASAAFLPNLSACMARHRDSSFWILLNSCGFSLS